MLHRVVFSTRRTLNIEPQRSRFAARRYALGLNSNKSECVYTLVVILITGHIKIINGYINDYACAQHAYVLDRFYGESIETAYCEKSREI